MKRKIYILLIIVLLLFLVGVIFFQHQKIVELKDQPVPTDTITIVTTDTLTVTKPTLTEREVVRYDTLILYTTDTLIDTFQVPVPISSYTLDTLLPDSTHFFGVLRGFGVSVDTLSITYPKVTETVYLTHKKWSFSYGFVLGIGVSKPF